MSVPRLSHLQFLVIGIIQRRPVPGREVRERLRSFGVKRSGPAFYQMMSRLEDADLVVGSYHQDVVEGQMIRERHYSVTGAGSVAWDASRDFYLRALEDFGDLGGLAGA